MTLNLRMPEQHELRPRITVFGVGGAGGNAVNNMIEKALEGADFVTANTDAQALAQSNATTKVQLGEKVTQGLGAGARPDVGAAAAEESLEAIIDQLDGVHMCFITAGMGGGTGTGAAPIIARAAREMGVLTVGVVTKPFQFEGAKRMRQAELGVDELQKVVDTLIIIPNQNLFRLANEKTTFTEAFSMADDVLYQGVKGVTDLMVRPGIINLDFADIRSVMDEMGKAMMGTGEAEGEDRAVQAAEKAIANPLLDEISLKGAKGVLINITGGDDLTLFELDEAANRIRSEVDPDANIIVGSTLDGSMNGMMRVSVVATGIDAAERAEPLPMPRRTTVAVSKPAPEIIEEPVIEEQPEPVAAEPEPTFFEAAPEPVVEYPEPELVEREEFGVPAEEADVAARLAEPEVYYEPEPEPEVYHEPEPFRPAARRPGEPTAEALARLQAAVAKVPDSPAAQRTVRDKPRTEEGPSRFAINSLIHKMTGQSPRETRPAASHDRIPPLSAPNAAYGQEPEREEQDRSEIPAFLRRQAN
jgi:cell division protein FtsZ